MSAAFEFSCLESGGFFMVNLLARIKNWRIMTSLLAKQSSCLHWGKRPLLASLKQSIACSFARISQEENSIRRKS
jgi:hypothetical protein